MGFSVRHWLGVLGQKPRGPEHQVLSQPHRSPAATIVPSPPAPTPMQTRRCPREGHHSVVALASFLQATSSDQTPHSGTVLQGSRKHLFRTTNVRHINSTTPMALSQALTLEPASAGPPHHAPHWMSPAESSTGLWSGSCKKQVTTCWAELCRHPTLHLHIKQKLTQRTQIKAICGNYRINVIVLD